MRNRKGVLYRLSVAFRWNWDWCGFWNSWRRLWLDTVFSLAIAVFALLQAATALVRAVLHPLVHLLIEPIYFGLRAKDDEVARRERKIIESMGKRSENRD